MERQFRSNSDVSVEDMTKDVRDCARSLHQRAERYEKIADSMAGLNLDAAREIFTQLKDER